MSAILGIDASSSLANDLAFDKIVAIAVSEEVEGPVRFGQLFQTRAFARPEGAVIDSNVTCS